MVIFNAHIYCSAFGLCIVGVKGWSLLKKIWSTFSVDISHMHCPNTDLEHTIEIKTKLMANLLMDNFILSREASKTVCTHNLYAFYSIPMWSPFPSSPLSYTQKYTCRNETKITELIFIFIKLVDILMNWLFFKLKILSLTFFLKGKYPIGINLLCSCE